MSNQKTKIGLIIVLLGFASIAAYSSVMQALLAGFVSALVVPPVAGMISIVYFGKKSYSLNETDQ